MSEIKAGAILNYIRLFISIGVGLFLSPFILDSLGKSEYGIYSIAGTIIGWLALCDFGLSASTTKFLSEYQANGDKEGEAHYLGNVAVLFSIIGGVVLFAGLGIYPFLGNIFPKFSEAELSLYRILYLMTLFNSALMFPAKSLGGISASRQKYKIPGIVATIMSLATTATTVVVIILGYKSIVLCAVSIVFGILGMLWNVYYCFGVLKARMTWNGWDISLCKTMFAFSVWMFLDQIVSIFTWGCGNFVVGATLGAQEIAAYSYGLNLMNYYFMFSGCVAGLYLPRIVSIVVNKEGTDAIEREWCNVGRIQLFSMGLLLTGIIFVGDAFLRLWIGKTLGNDIYISYYVTLCIIVPMTPALIQALNWQILQASNLMRKRVLGMILISSVCLCVGCLIINQYGAIGFACTTGFAFFLGPCVYTNYVLKKYVGVSIRGFVHALFTNSLIPSIVIIAIGVVVRSRIEVFDSWWKLILFLCGYCVIYLFLMINFYLNSNERKYFPVWLKKIIIIAK